MTDVKEFLRHEIREAKKLLRRQQKRIPRLYILIVLVCALFVFGALFEFDHYLVERYASLESPAILDRTGATLTLAPNAKEQYGRYTAAFPPRVRQLLVQKEDRFFYWHLGVNPISNVRAAFRYALGYPTGGASTITQQLVKNMLGNEQDRTIVHKLIETTGAIALELFNSKETILTMYANSIYMGNQMQGLEAASMLYFNEPISQLDDTKLSMLLATISSPSVQNPWRDENARTSRNLAIRLGIPFDPHLAIITTPHPYAPPQNFELSSMHIACATTCTTTLDKDLTTRLRAMLERHVLEAYDSGARSGAIVVIKEPENEILALVGTPDVSGQEAGQQINMTLQPRPIGSTAKPFIYLEGFMAGLRPYTLIDDREYKFPIGTGFPLYPKNYDGQYRGWITLHSALAGSINVAAVKVLQYVGLDTFYGFLQRSLGFEPLRDFDTYQYGIALGALEMDPLTLAHFLTLFPKGGTLAPLQLFESGTSSPYISTPMSALATAQRVADPAFVQLVSKVLSDRLTGVEQFGLESSLNLSQDNYAVKTGTSENFHDSWTVGYTPDFLIVVWFGDPRNASLKHVSGQTGAGVVWHDAMEMLMNSPYDHKTPLDFSKITQVPIDGSLEIALPGDVVSEHQNLLPDNPLIMSPQDGDTFKFDPRMVIPLISPQEVEWYANGEYLGKGERITYSPSAAQDYIILARGLDGSSARLTFHVTAKQ